MESQDYEYPVEAWLQDMEMELGNAGEYEKRMEFCNKVLEMFDWTYVAEDGFRCAVGEELYEAGKKETGNYSGSFRMYLYDTIGWVSLAYSFVV